MNVAAVYHNGVRKVLEANLGFKNYDTPKWDIFINDHKSEKISENYVFEIAALKYSNLSNGDPIIMYLQYDETHRL